MKKQLIKTFLLFGLVLLNNFGVAQTSNDASLSENAPTDKPHSIKNSEQLKRYEELIEPYVQQAKASLPDAKEKYLNGLKDGQAFFLTTRIYDANGNYEQIFVRVTNWGDSNITGTIANELNTVKNYSYGQLIKFPENAVLDWLITNPDGTEDGNYVGKFLDSLNASNNDQHNRYEMQGHSISVALPDDWLFTSLSGGAAFKAQSNCSGKEFCNNIVFTFIGNSTNSTEEEFGRMLVSQLPRQFQKYELHNQSDTTVNNIKYRVIDYSVVQPDGNYNSTSLIKSYKQRVVIINYTAKAKKKKSYKEDRDLFFSVIETIEIEE
ncbi:DUF2314 domain-containing protein [Fulvivirga lutea]|uniref:DUF2314 domain-containing protein n=1 Tax=Fulvivirga lutea TaxID=2810512 RepID=A0A974WI56_9BACT|nr:DUF2314 domain-containing protein [Fulvivirga lutea]QSE98998.1 DUF2314 domain-containing protein [Fulvivirga lutea]